MKIQCEIIRDILPLYAEDMVSQPTRELVEEHLGECDSCTGELEVLKNQSVTVESGIASLKRVKEAIRRRRVLSVLTVFLLIATLLIGGALLLDAPVYMSAEEAVKEIYIEGDTVKIIWDDRVIGTGAQSGTENYTVTAWTNVHKMIKPTERIPYDALDDEIKAFISREQYDSVDNTSTYSQEEGSVGMNFWYCNPAKGTIKLILDQRRSYDDAQIMMDGKRIKTYVLGLAVFCAACLTVCVVFRDGWARQLMIRLGILAGSGAISAVIVTAGQLVDIHAAFSEMLVDSTAVMVPMVLFALCVLQLIRLNRQDKGL